ncbi:unnamed protein product [Caenorhabditis sp. 36 PRJEB53466]|nr:unnamed protein product [Caenorhabditis sp. 36 PRJEB53466]
MISFSDESNLSIFFCFYIIISIVTINFYRILKGKGKVEELYAYPCVPALMWLHFVGLALPIVNIILIGLFSIISSDLSAHPIVYTPTALSLLYHDTMADWMVPLILFYAFTLSYDLPDFFHFRYIKIPRDTLIWTSMLTYGCLFNSFNPWDIITIRRIHHENGHISTSFNFVDAFLVAVSIILIGLHGYRMSWGNAFRDNRFHLTLLFVGIKLAFLLTGACFLPSIPDHSALFDSSEPTAHAYSLDNLKLYESVVQGAIPLHYLAWKHLFFKNI